MGNKEFSWSGQTNTTSSLSGKIEAGFRVMLSCGPRLLLCGP